MCGANGRVLLTLWILIQFQLTVPISVVFAKGTLLGDQERKLPFKENQEAETPLNCKSGWGKLLCAFLNWVLLLVPVYLMPV